MKKTGTILASLLIPGLALAAWGWLNPVTGSATGTHVYTNDVPAALESVYVAFKTPASNSCTVAIVNQNGAATNYVAASDSALDVSANPLKSVVWVSDGGDVRIMPGDLVLIQDANNSIFRFTINRSK